VDVAACAAEPTKMTISANANQKYSRPMRLPFSSIISDTHSKARSISEPEQANGWLGTPELISRHLHIRLRYVTQRDVQILQNAIHFLLGL
jgi:hypothetical protein